MWVKNKPSQPWHLAEYIIKVTACQLVSQKGWLYQQKDKPLDRLCKTCARAFGG